MLLALQVGKSNRRKIIFLLSSGFGPNHSVEAFSAFLRDQVASYPKYSTRLLLCYALWAFKKSDLMATKY